MCSRVVGSWTLVVEDDPSQRELLLSLLRREGIETAAVQNGMEALRYLLKYRDVPSLMIVDVNMPVLDGFSFLNIAKGQPDLAAIPFIMMSGEGEDWVARAKRLGASACFQKPFDISRLVAMVQQYCARKPERWEHSYH